MISAIGVGTGERLYQLYTRGASLKTITVGGLIEGLVIRGTLQLSVLATF